MRLFRTFASLLCAVLLMALSGCSATNDKTGDAGPADARGDAGAAETTSCKRFKIIGQPCTDDCECLGGPCVLNEYAPFRFCTTPCMGAQPGSACEPEVEGAAFSTFCIDFPSDFRVQPGQFCAPLCNDILDCNKLGAPWESCEMPQWKGNPLYPSTPDKVCISPSAQGHEPIDPDTCENWEGLFNEFQQERAACISYCDFLDVCQVLAAETSSPCCAFYCTSAMIKNGKVDKEYFQYVRCYIDSYNAFRGSALVCTKPLSDCGEDPDQP